MQLLGILRLRSGYARHQCRSSQHIGKQWCHWAFPYNFCHFRRDSFYAEWRRGEVIRRLTTGHNPTARFVSQRGMESSEYSLGVSLPA